MSISDFANVVMAVATLGSLFYIARQVNDAKKHTKGQFLLELDDRFSAYNHISQRLFETNPPLDPNIDPSITWSELALYIGFFERIKVMLDDNILDLALVYRLYGYRIYRIIHNNAIFADLKDGPEIWQDFIRLCKDLALYRQSEGIDQVDQDFIDRVQQLKLIQTRCEEDWRNC